MTKETTTTATATPTALPTLHLGNDKVTVPLAATPPSLEEAADEILEGLTPAPGTGMGAAPRDLTIVSEGHFHFEFDYIIWGEDRVVKAEFADGEMMIYDIGYEGFGHGDLSKGDQIDVMEEAKAYAKDVDTKPVGPFYIVRKDGVKLSIPHRSRGVGVRRDSWKTKGAATQALKKAYAGNTPDIAAYEVVPANWYKPVMVERTNIMSGEKFMEDINTPNYMSPASEAYFSM